jgi:hypothetical protein
MKQEMGMRIQQHEWQKKNQAFAEQLRPLEYKAKQFQLENQFRIQAEQRMKPFLADIQGEFQQLLMDRPELASEAQNVYANGIDGILTKGVSDPSIDIGAEISKKKDEMRQWIQKNRQKIIDVVPNPKARPSVDGTSPSRASLLSSAAYNPMIEVERKDGERNLDRDDVSRAATIYAGFGGNPKDFILKYDPDEKSRNEAQFKVHLATGKMPPPEIYATFTPDQQKMVDDRARQMQSLSMYNSASEAIVEQVKALRMQDKDLVDAGQSPVNGETIADLVSQLGSINSERAKAMGYGVSKVASSASGDAPTRPTKEDILNSIPTSDTPSIETSQSKGLNDMLASDFSRIESIVKDVSEVDESVLDSIRSKYISNPDSVSKSDIEKLISKSTPDRIESLANAQWFKNHIDQNNLGISGSGERAQQTSLGRAMQVLTSEARPFMEDIFSPSEKRVFTSKRDRLWSDKEKQDARKVLKSELPKILFDYLNQSR